MRFITRSAVAMLVLILAAGTTELKAQDGIHFFEGSWQQVLKKAKDEHKLIFLDISTSWCGWCRKMKQNVYTDKTLGDYFNKNFVNVELDGEHDDGLRLAQKFGVSGYPSLFIVDGNEQQLFSSEGYHEANDLMTLVKSVVKDRH